MESQPKFWSSVLHQGLFITTEFRGMWEGGGGGGLAMTIRLYDNIVKSKSNVTMLNNIADGNIKNLFASTLQKVDRFLFREAL